MFKSVKLTLLLLGLVLAGCSSNLSTQGEILLGSKTVQIVVYPNGDITAQAYAFCSAGVDMYRTTSGVPLVFGRLTWSCTRLISARHGVSIENVFSGQYSSNPASPSPPVNNKPPVLAPITAASAVLDTGRIASLPGDIYCVYGDLKSQTPDVTIFSYGGLELCLGL